MSRYGSIVAAGRYLPEVEIGNDELNRRFAGTEHEDLVVFIGSGVCYNQAGAAFRMPAACKARYGRRKTAHHAIPPGGCSPVALRGRRVLDLPDLEASIGSTRQEDP
jgi:hypothetical protein